jgi:lyso-ornithine lipid O-acyltransferase
MGATTLRLWRLAVYLAWTLPLMPVQAFGIALRQKWTASFPRFYHRVCCRILGLRVRQIGQPTALGPVLFAANHVSYLDITVLGSLIPGSFIAKAEVSGWPLLGWLAKLQRSVFVDRQVRSTAQQRDAIAERLAARDALILFPEGTSSDGNRVLPFKSALFDVANGRRGMPPVTVQPVSVAYTRLDGMPIRRGFRPLFAWYGDMAMAPHLWRLLGLGRIEIVVQFHDPVAFADFGSRKALSAYCEACVVGGVNAALTGRQQKMPGPPALHRHHPLAADLPVTARG